MNKNVKIAKQLLKIAKALIAGSNHTEDNVDKWLHLEYPTEYQHIRGDVTFSYLMSFLSKDPIDRVGIYDCVTDVDTMPREKVLHELLYRYLSSHKDMLTDSKKDDLLGIWTDYGFESVMEELGLNGVDDDWYGWRIKGSKIDVAINTLKDIKEKMTQYDNRLEDPNETDMDFSSSEFMDCIESDGYAVGQIGFKDDLNRFVVEFGVNVNGNDFYLIPCMVPSGCAIQDNEEKFGSEDQLIARMKEILKEYELFVE